MAIANSSQHTLFFDAEAAYGDQDASTAYVEVEHATCNFNVTKSAIESERIRGDRNIDDSRHGVHTVGGEITAELSYAPSNLTLLEAALGGTYTTGSSSAADDDIVKVGSSRRSFTFERNFKDITAGDFHYYQGMEVSSVSISVAPDAMVGVTYGFVGKSLTVSDAIDSHGSDTAVAAAIKPFDSFSAVIKEAGSTVANVTGLEITIENGLAPAFIIGSKFTSRPALGKCRVTGNLTAFFEDKTLLNKFLDEDESSLEITFTDGTNSLKIAIPRIKFNSGQTDVSGEEQISLGMDFQALYDSTSATTISIDKTP